MDLTASTFGKKQTAGFYGLTQRGTQSSLPLRATTARPDRFELRFGATAPPDQEANKALGEAALSWFGTTFHDIDKFAESLTIEQHGRIAAGAPATIISADYERLSRQRQALLGFTDEEWAEEVQRDFDRRMSGSSAEQFNRPQVIGFFVRLTQAMVDHPEQVRIVGPMDASLLAAKALRESNANPIVIAFPDYDYSTVVLGLQPGTDDMNTWGNDNQVCDMRTWDEDVVIVDALLGKVMTVDEALPEYARLFSQRTGQPVDFATNPPRVVELKVTA